MNVQRNTPAPSGNTQTQATLFGAHGTKNGQPVAKKLATSPTGALMVSVPFNRYNGGVAIPSAGLTFVHADGLLVYAGAAQSAPPPPPEPRPPHPK